MFEPTEQQREDLANDYAVNHGMLDDRIHGDKSDAYRRAMDDLIAAPAFHAIIRAAQQHAWQEGAKAGWDASGEGWNNEWAHSGSQDSTWEGMQQAFGSVMPQNPYSDAQSDPTYTRDDARDDHAINQWEIANDLRDEA